jgi:hypothetical protein
MIEEATTFDIHLENIGSDIVRFVAFATGKILTPEAVQAEMSKNIRGSSRASTRWGWDDLPKELQEYAERHGYGR